MATRPSHSAATAAADRIATRRMDQRDPHLDRMPESLLTLVAYVHVYPAVAGRPGVTDQELRIEDARDALTILDYLAGEMDRQRLATIRLARAAGPIPGGLARLLGKQTRQTAEAEYARLEASVNHKSSKSERATRTARATERAEAERARTRAAQIRSLAVDLLSHWAHLPEYLDVGYGQSELRYHVTHECPVGATPPPGMVSGLKLLVAALADVPLSKDLRAAVDLGTKILYDDPAGEPRRELRTSPGG